MTEFATVRDFLREHLDELPMEFRREFETLCQNWQADSDRDSAFWLQETWRLVAKYSQVQTVLSEAGLKAEGEPPPQPPSPQRARSPAITSSRAKSEQTDGKPGLSQNVQERLAIWDKKIVTAKEIVAGCLGCLIVLVTLLIALVGVFSAIFNIGSSDTWSAVKDILLILNGLVGVVLGYYFGRVPSEARTNQAESEARAAQSVLDRTIAGTRAILEEAGGGDISRSRGDLTLNRTQLDRLRQLLDRARP